MMHHLRANKTIGTVILSPEAQRRLLRDQANESFDAFLNGDEDEDAFDGRIQDLDQAMTLAKRARRVKSLR